MTFEQVQFAATVAIAVFGPILGYFVHDLNTSIKELKSGEREVMRQIANIRAELPLHYVRSDHLEKQMDAIFQMLRRIEDKVDNKVDRP